MPALLQEVRGLRAAIEQMTASASRVQLALGRLQLQEQRLTRGERPAGGDPQSARRRSAPRRERRSR